jgi:hypothetical protein
MPEGPNWGRGPVASLEAAVRSVLPRYQFNPLCLGRVIKFAAGAVDVQPDDPDRPTMSSVPVLNGLPGLTIGDIVVGTRIAVGWSESDPSRPYAALWAGGEHVASMTLAADALALGGAELAEPPLKATTTLQALTVLLTALSTYATAIKPTADPGGAATAALVGAISSFLAAQATYQATNVVVK